MAQQDEVTAHEPESEEEIRRKLESVRQELEETLEELHEASQVRIETLRMQFSV